MTTRQLPLFTDEEIERRRGMKRRRNPRRVVKDVKRRCYQYGSAIVSKWVCILSCGHEVVGYPDTIDYRKACPECGREAQCAAS